MAFLWAHFLILALPTSPVFNADDTPIAYKILQEYDFPVGLLPKGVESYGFDNSTGKFTVYLNGTCSLKFESYELKYKSTIKSVKAKDKLSKLSGIEVKVLILWLNIVELTHDELLKFSMGSIASADFPMSNLYGSLLALAQKAAQIVETV